MSSAIIERCFAIVEVLSRHRFGLSLGAIADHAGMPKSAAHRMLTALCDEGSVVQLDNRDYKLTLKLPALGLTYLSNTNILGECQPVLDGLARDVGELVRLALVEEDDLIWIAKAQGARSGLMIDPVMGQHVVTHATASGKVWLASLSQEDALRSVFRDDFGKVARGGPNEVQTVDGLLGELKLTATRGYGLADEEAEPGISAIAVGIVTGTGDRLLGTVSVAGPSARLTTDRLLEFLPKLQKCACQLVGLDALHRAPGQASGP